MSLSYTIYNLLLAPAAALYLPLALAQYRSKRAGTLRPRLGLETPELEPGGLWVHALSVGEVVSARGFLEELRRIRPDVRIWLSASTATGMDMAREEVKKGRADAAFFFPLDLAPVVNRTLNKLRPQGVVIVETDVWPNFLRACRLRRIPTALVNFRISPNRHRSHKLLTGFFRSVYSQLAAVAFPTADDQRRFEYLGVGPSTRTMVTGSLKYDQPPRPVERPQALGLDPGRPVLVAGSTHAGEEEIVLEAWRRLRAEVPELALILAPRDAPRFKAVAEMLRARGVDPARLSRGEDFGSGSEVVLVDTLGRLAGLYGLGWAAFVGGSLVDQGGHNPLEPAALGVPVIFGPYVEDFVSEAKALVAAGGGLVVNDAESLYQAWRSLVTDAALAEAMGRAARRVFEAHRGAARRVAELVAEVMGW